ncbi:hypothetical protein M0G43_10115 [Subsaxibacter sp. CAU 1640]|uniref:hypothetical protein n=1 Tax=Subsaxibacter sp. CAU 1640 TaxID=2933271 RepID=UPI00200558AC|nr:hypothetical protein [Subsaxibacter sp. CAU 1640]MCK7590926.1 hypothetical protein [Subsaxibacter sp. CAU 1640]
MNHILTLLITLLSISSFAQEQEYSLEYVTAVLDSIKIADIKEPCDCSDGMEKIADIMVKSMEGYTSRQQIMSDTLGVKIVNITTIKTQQVAKRCQGELRLTDNDIYDCESFKLLEEKSKVLNRKFGN